MQRNMDLIRDLLLRIEGEASTQYEFNMEGVDDLEKWYNVDLLVQANLLRGCVRSLGHVLEWRYETQSISQRPD